jgi:hypothetical protein
LALSATASAVETFNSIYISEALVQREVPRKDGKDFGWIELYNGGSSRVNLEGWFLSDTTNRTKWAFPKVVILPDSYLVVSASGTNRTDDLADLHANFALDVKGGQVALIRGGTNVVSRLVKPESKRGVS